MPANKSKTTSSKGKTTARKNATKRIADRGGSAEHRARGTDKEVSQGRFPGETPLTGEDRPAGATGGKKGRGSRRKA